MTWRPRVLLAEDHPGMTRAVCRLLALDCDVVETVADGRAVVEAARRLRPDVIVVDLNLPIISGLDACREITRENAVVRVIVFTAMNDPELRQLAAAAGAAAFVYKGAGDEDLLSVIKRLCADRSSA